ncbi:MAG: hypothetical protein EOP05_03855 [Proteobacteria bacterium]|nr:MAG: hypothetical protein EOP05_03855 [Pseudomonadota bacterium]
MKKQSVEQCSFQPWTKRIELSAPHLTSHLGCDRIQYFAFNHEVCHTALFGGFYKRAPGETDQEIVENLMLIEWFCIASDFVLAQQIGSFNAGLRLIEELSNIEHDLSGPLEDRILKRTATNRAFGIEASEELKSCFLEAIQSPVANSPFEYTEQLIGRSTIDFHISFCSDNLMPRLPISDSVKLRSERRELTMKLKSMNVFELAELVC